MGVNMKTFKKLSLALVALCLAFTAVSCNHGSIVKTWTGTPKNFEAGDSTFKLTAYADTFYDVTMSVPDGSLTITISEGTYKLNDDGSAEFTETKTYDSSTGKLVDVESPETVKVTDINEFELTLEFMSSNGDEDEAAEDGILTFKIDAQ